MTNELFQTISSAVTNDLTAITSTNYVLWLLVFVLVGLAYARPNGTQAWRERISYALPKSHYFGSSGREDLWIVVINATIIGILLTIKPAQMNGLATSFFGRLDAFFTGASQAPASSTTPSFLLNLSFAVSSALWFELAWYVHHVAFHKVPILWAFHKVHHSALTMTPITTKRTHLVELFTLILVVGFFTDVNFLIFRRLGFPPENLGALASVFFICFSVFAALRHSHIPLSFGRLESVFFSPRRHQFHHSCRPEHVDKNYGYFLTLFDRLFSTLYSPSPEERPVLGLPEQEQSSGFRFPGAPLVTPFIECWALLRRGEVFRFRKPG